MLQVFCQGLSEQISALARTRRFDHDTASLKTPELAGPELFLYLQTLWRRLEELTRQRENHAIWSHLLDRALDGLDDQLRISYESDEAPWHSGSRERLYEGGARGVQSSYLTLFEAARAVGPGLRWMDLGSGFGRAGLTWALLDPTCETIGYEFVEARVEQSRRAAERAGVSDRAHFYTQDLADSQFRLPEADVFYLYDPFVAQTYQQILTQILEQGRRRSVTVIAKGCARTWLREALRREAHWAPPRHCDKGFLTLEQSRPEVA